MGEEETIKKNNYMQAKRKRRVGRPTNRSTVGCQILIPAGPGF